jgi:hypothetical protein
MIVIQKKWYLVVLLLGIGAFFFLTCTTNPDWVVEKFTKHWFKGELEEAKTYLAPESRKYADLLQNVKSPEELELMSKKKVKVKVLEVTKQNDSIRVYHCEIALNE